MDRIHPAQSTSAKSIDETYREDVVSPQEFYRVFTNRSDVREIMQRLANGQPRFLDRSPDDVDNRVNLEGTVSSVSIVIETDRGTIEAVVDAERAPITAANFLAYVDGGHYDGGRFHRTVTMGNQPNDAVRIEVIQGGINPDRPREGATPIALERTSTTGLRHEDGTISMARREPDGALSDFFICIGDQPSLDFGGPRNPDGQGFAAFGRVVRGMDVVRAIQQAPADGQTLTPPIEIRRVRRRGANRSEAAS